MIERGFFGPAENTLLLVSHGEERGLLAVRPDGSVAPTDAGRAWVREREAELGRTLDVQAAAHAVASHLWAGKLDRLTDMLLVHLSYEVAKDAGVEALADFEAVLHEIAQR